MKKLIFALLICLWAVAAKAQIGYNYSQYELGVSAGTNSPIADFKKPKSTYAFNGHFAYNYTPYVNFLVEVGVGALKADSTRGVPTLLSFNNNYTSVAFRAQLQAGELIDYSNSKFLNVIKNFYIGTGVAVMYTDLKIYDAGLEVSQGKGSAIYIPTRLGYEFKFFNSYNEPFMKLDLGYQLNSTFSDNAVDGYSYGGTPDNFTQFSIGLRFAIGGHTSYSKAIHW